MTKINTRYNGLVNHESGKAYDIAKLQRILQGRPFNMWRYKELLPMLDEDNIVSLGEGFSPILDMGKLAKKYDFKSLLVKNEGGNPTGSFKSRGLGMAVSKAAELGVKEFSIPTAGNAGSALSAYCAKGDLQAHIYMPKATPKMFQLDCEIMGAKVNIIDGNISDCGAAMRADNADGQWWDVTTLKEPFRLEGKKTMGLEIAEQLNWKLPDVIIYPTGGGTGLIGIWKAFQEMKELGWVDNIPTRMVAVQTTGCNPIVQAFEAGLHSSTPFSDPAETIANGLRVPHAFGHKLIMKTIYESGGCALAVTEEEIKSALSEFAQEEGHFLSPEGAAVWQAAKKLKESGWIKDSDQVVLLNTGSGYKYAENLW